MVAVTVDTMAADTAGITITDITTDGEALARISQTTERLVV
jgi:hypothetical protein